VLVYQRWEGSGVLKALADFSKSRLCFKAFLSTKLSLRAEGKLDLFLYWNLERKFIFDILLCGEIFVNFLK